LEHEDEVVKGQVRVVARKAPHVVAKPHLAPKRACAPAPQ
jgi:hypothetical protein